MCILYYQQAICIRRGCF